jgi:AraC-like DNA-binding protein
MAELTDQVVALGDIWDRPSCDALMGLGSAANAPDRAVELLERLLGRAGPEPPSALATRRAIEALRRAVYLPGVRQLAAVLGASERQLRRAFSEVIGLSPKQYLRVLRFRRVLDETRRTAAPSWPDLAVRAGYYDQAHLIAEFRAMTGSTPAAWIASSSTAS